LEEFEHEPQVVPGKYPFLIVIECAPEDIKPLVLVSVADSHIFFPKDSVANGLPVVLPCWTETIKGRVNAPHHWCTLILELLTNRNVCTSWYYVNEDR
jgi:hypothetical protein